MTSLLLRLAATFLVVVSALTPAAGAVRRRTVMGYLIDVQCVDLCDRVDVEACTPDRVNVFRNPGEHAGWCLQLYVCERSGYVIMSEHPAGEFGRHEIILALEGEESQQNAVKFIAEHTVGSLPFPKVLVEDDDGDDHDVYVLPGNASQNNCSDEWNQAAALWQTKNQNFQPFSCYEFASTSDSLGSSGTTIVEVKDGVALEDGQRSLEDYMSLIGDFCYSSCKATCRIQFDGGENYPREIFIDTDPFQIGEEIKLSISDYKQVPCNWLPDLPPPRGINASFYDPWAYKNTNMEQDRETYQVLCERGDTPDIRKNNLCFRSDVQVSEFNAFRGHATYRIESNGCPDHVNMKGSAGLIANDQEETKLNGGSAPSGDESDVCGAEAKDCGNCGVCGASGHQGACGGYDNHGCGAGSCGGGCTACGAYFGDHCGVHGNNSGCSGVCGACGTTGEHHGGCGACGTHSSGDWGACGASSGGQNHSHHGACGGGGCGSWCGACGSGACGAGDYGGGGCGSWCGATGCVACGAGDYGGCGSWCGATACGACGAGDYGGGGCGSWCGATGCGACVAGDYVGCGSWCGACGSGACGSCSAAGWGGCGSVGGCGACGAVDHGSGSSSSGYNCSLFCGACGEANSGSGSTGCGTPTGGADAHDYDCTQYCGACDDNNVGCSTGGGAGGGACGSGCGSRADDSRSRSNVLSSGKHCRSLRKESGVFTPFYQHYFMEIPQDPGLPGVAKPMENDVIGIMTNGVLLDAHNPTWTYDNCGGHSDTQHQYHYHLPPFCFLLSMHLIPFADSPDWWIDDSGSRVRNYTDMPLQFPATGPPSPMVGLARDGFPIYGIYDEFGRLVTRDSGDLDECNGKVDRQGNYAYYWSVQPPFAPSCLRGDVGAFTYYSTNETCPAHGVVNKVLNATACSGDFAELGDCRPSAHEQAPSRLPSQVPLPSPPPLPLQAPTLLPVVNEESSAPTTVGTPALRPPITAIQSASRSRTSFSFIAETAATVMALLLMLL